MADIGKRIKHQREAIKLTQEELAEKLGYKNKSSITKIENGTNDIPQSKVVEFAKALNTTVSYLMGWEDDTDTDTDTDDDVDIRRIARAHKQMTDEDRKRFMKIITAAFDEYFPDDTEK